MFLEASFRADINLLDECLQIQKLANICIKVIVFCVTPIVPESFMTVSSTNVLVKLFLMVGGFGGRSFESMTGCLGKLKLSQLVIICKPSLNMNKLGCPVGS